MNELEHIRRFYSDVPDRDAADRARRVARDALRTRMDALRLRRWSAGVVARRRRRLAAALAGTCALVGIGAVLLSGTDSGLAPGPGTAAAYLDQAARSAARSDEPWRLGPGTYWYVSYRVVNTGSAARCDGPVKRDFPNGGFAVRRDCGTTTVEDWEAIDDSGRSRSSGPTGADGKTHHDDHPADPHPQGTRRPYIDLAGLNISYEELVDMRGDDLAERVRAHAERLATQRQAESDMTTTDYLFLFVGNLLAEQALSPDQRAALYHMIARQPDIRSLGEATDPEGRRGVAVGAGDEGRERIIIFDPDTSRVLATGTGLSGRTPPAGLSSGQYIVFLRSGVVGSTSETP
jgi:hypothetical protein